MRPRELLEGEKLDGGWIVGKMITRKGGTGSNFSAGYLVYDPDGREFYLKAMDYHEAMQKGQLLPASLLNPLFCGFVLGYSPQSRNRPWAGRVVFVRSADEGGAGRLGGGGAPTRPVSP